MSKKIFLITGTSGFIGSNLHKYFLEKKISCLSVSRKKIDSLDINVINYQEVIKLYNENTFLIHFAGDNKLINKEEFETIEVLSNTFKEKMYFISSGQVYGLSHEYDNTEKSPLDDHSEYAKLKILAENIVASNNGRILRLSNIYGKGMSKDTVWYHILEQSEKNNSIITLQNKAAIRDFLYIDDLCSLLCKIVTSEKCFDIINVGSGKGISLSTLAEIICEITNPDNKIREIISENDIKIRNVLDVSLARVNYNWEPKTSIIDGIKFWLS